MRSPSVRTNREAILLAAAMLIAGTIIIFAQGGGAGVSSSPPPAPSASPSVVNPSNSNTAQQRSYTPLTPSTPSTTPSTPSSASSGEPTSPANNEQPNTTARSERGASAAKTRSVHRHRRHFAGPMLGSYCGSSPCVRIVVAEPPPVYRASVLWWPGYYDYAPGQYGRGHPRYGGYRTGGGRSRIG
jgi:hypothetical protein